MNKHQTVLLGSLAITLVVFFAGIGLNYVFDFYRLEEVTRVVGMQQLATDSYLLHDQANIAYGLDRCTLLGDRVTELRKSTQKVGIDLQNYGVLSYFKKQDFDYLRRQYYLLELQLYALVQEYDAQCSNVYTPILFFFDESPISQRQGFVLEDVTRAFDDAVVLSFDLEYTGERILTELAGQFNITEAPAMVIGGQLHTGITYLGEINRSIRDHRYQVDPYASVDFSMVPVASGLGLLTVESLYAPLLNESLPPVAAGDIRLVLGRLRGDPDMICSALAYYDQASINATTEEQAILLEAIASIGCGRSRRAFLFEAADRWDALNVSWRAVIDKRIAYGLPLGFDVDLQPIAPVVAVPKDPHELLIGQTALLLVENDTLLSQADRVSRDWLSGQLYQAPDSTNRTLTTFSERLSWTPEELHPDIGWHEGARINDLKAELPLRHVIGTGTLVVRSNGKWYAPNEQGVFMFEVPIDKVSYPTAFFLTPDVAVLPDTHGVNMLVEQAIRDHADVVVGCCDHPGKVQAAAYLGERNISVICLTDLYVPDAIGHNLPLVGSPPFARTPEGIEVGDRPLSIAVYEPLVVMNASDEQYALWYYKTPARYFRSIEQFVDLNATYVTIHTFAGMDEVVAMADATGAQVIAVRVFSSNDYEQVKAFLDESPSHQAVLFHSASYPFGQKIFREYPGQTTFDDPNILVVS